MKVIIAGATGMVGKGVLLECLNSELVKDILVIGRQSVGLEHPKMKEILHSDLFDLSSISDHLKGYDACFFCVGVSSFRMDEDAYTKVTHDLPVSFADELKKHNQYMVFHYVSAEGSDVSGGSKSMWKNVKGRAESSLQGLGFDDCYIYRPAYIKPEKLAPSSTPIYNVLLPILGILHPAIVRMFPKYSTTVFDIGRAMIKNTVTRGAIKTLGSEDINRVSGLL